MPSLHPSRDIDAILREGYKVDIGARVQEGIEIFKSRMKDLLIFGCIALGILIVIGVAFGILNFIVSKVISVSLLLRLLGSVEGFVYGVVMTVMFSALYRYLFGLMRGDKVTINDFLVVDDQTSKIVTLAVMLAAVQAVLSFIGFCIFPLIAMVFGILTFYALPLVVDRGMDPIAAIKASIRVFLKNPLESLILLIVCGIMMILGLFVAGAGLAFSTLACAYVHIFGISGVSPSVDASAA